MASKSLRIATAAAAFALVTGATAPAALAETSTLGEDSIRSYNYGATQGSNIQPVRPESRYLQGSGASQGNVGTRNTARVPSQTAPSNEGRYLRGSGASQGNIGTGR